MTLSTDQYGQFATWRISLLTVFLAAAVGALSVPSPLFTAAAVLAAAAVVALVTLGQGYPSLFLRVLIILLIGYAFLNKGFAYLGVAPVYVGEATLALALLSLVVTAPRARLRLLHWLLFAYMAWGLFRTVPYLSRDGLYAVRDAVLWTYAAFAVAVSFAVEPRHFHAITALYRKFIPVFLASVPVVAVVYLLLQSSLPKVPGSDVPLLVFKAGDSNVHLAAIAAFLLLGLYASRPSAAILSEILLWPAWLLAVGVAGAINRGGLLSVGVGIVAVFLIRPSGRWLRFFWVVALVVAVLAVLNPTINVGLDRTISPAQVGRNIQSILSSNGGGDIGLRGTKDWRQRWWSRIISYTVHGPYFWTGKGFGINLADDDGFQVEANHALRDPHNSHLTILARTGVPGLLLWVTLQGVFGISLLRAFYRARRRGDILWLQIDGWLFVYWAAMLVNTSFDVYLEGPQGGIWFWSVFGLGLAALAAQRTTDNITVHTLGMDAYRHANPDRP
jgi:hypothetical protein